MLFLNVSCLCGIILIQVTTAWVYEQTECISVAVENKPSGYLLSPWYMKFVVLIVCDYVLGEWPLVATVL